MPFYFTHDSHKVALDDLPLDRWVTIQEETGKQWHEVLSSEIVGNTIVARSVITQACEQLGIPVPELTLRTMLELITFEAGESVPDQFNDGIPDPKATASEPETT